MAPAASKFTNNLTPPARRGQVKFKVVKMIAKSLQNLAIRVVGRKKKGVCNGGGGGRCCSSMGAAIPTETVGGLKSASERKVKQSRPKRGDVKIMIFKLIAKSVKDFANGVAGREKKAAGNGGGSFSSTTSVIPLETVGGLKSASEREVKQSRPKRGDVKIMIFMLIAKSIKDFAIGVAGREKKSAGDGGGSFGSTTSVIPLETVGGFKPDFQYEIKQTQPLRGEIKINIFKMMAGSIFPVPESGRKKKVDGGAWAGIVPMGLESKNER